MPGSGKLNDQNGILTGESDEKNQSELRIDAQIHMVEQQPGQRAQTRDRRGEHHRQRNDPAFVLRDQKQKAEDQRHGDEQRASAGGFGFLITQIRPVERVAGRQCFAGQFGDPLHGFAAADKRKLYGRDGRSGEFVVAVHGARRERDAGLEHTAQRNHVAAVVFDINLFDILHLIAERPVGLHVDVVHLSFKVHVVDVA